MHEYYEKNLNKWNKKSYWGLHVREHGGNIKKIWCYNRAEWSLDDSDL